MLAAARLHLSARGQPDTLTAHIEYPTRTMAGPAVIAIEDVKLGGRLSTLHITLWQEGLTSAAPWVTPSVSRRTALAYATQLNLTTFEGISIPAGFEVTPAAKLPPRPDLASLVAGGVDEDWELHKPPEAFMGYVRALLNWRFILPRGDTVTPGVLDTWVSMAGGERITQRTLPYLVDSFPFNVHLYVSTPEIRRSMMVVSSRTSSGSGDAKDGEKENREKDSKGASWTKTRGNMWFPTVAMNVEVKQALPEEGVEWLAMQITSKQLRQGKFDLHVTVRTLDGELVALSNQVALMMSAERNMAKRGSSL